MFQQLTGGRRLAVISALLFCASVSYAKTAAIKHDPPKPDDLCQRLFDEFVVARGKKLAGDTRSAADLIASRGRSTFWRPVLLELRRGNSDSEYVCVRILGRMLEADARDRDEIKAKVSSQRMPFVCLPTAVVPELIARAKDTRFLLSYYVLALARARDNRCTDLLLKALAGSGFNSTVDGGTKLIAAVGLANLGNRSGVEWLVAHVNDKYPAMTLAQPIKAANVDCCCVLALRALGARKDLKTRANLQTWWNKQPKPVKLREPIELMEMW